MLFQLNGGRDTHCSHVMRLWQSQEQMLEYWEARTCLYRQMKETFDKYGETIIITLLHQLR